MSKNARSEGDRGRVMPSELNVTQIFLAAELNPTGPVPWGTRIEETRAGVYALALVPDPRAGCGSIDISNLPPDLRGKWLDDQPVIYIGRTRRSLRHRIGQFYRHKYGNKSPHRGGQAALLLEAPLWVFWAATDQPAQAERAMIERFRDTTNALPFANRCRGTATEAPKPLIPDELNPPSGDAPRDRLRRGPTAG
jgi:hypothetical protein